jgi:hypothetical protein
MEKLILVFLTLLLIANITLAQGEKKDVIYLKNGSAIRGQIINRFPDGQIQIKRGDNSYQVYKLAQYDSIGKIYRTQPNFFNLIEAGILIGNSNDKYAAQPSLMNISGWKFKSGLSVGVGAGVEFLSEMYVPVVADFRYSLKGKGLHPFIGIQGGYSFAITKPDSIRIYYMELDNSFGFAPYPGVNLNVNAKGGFLLNPFIGISTTLNKKMAFTYSVGYRIMRLHYIRADDYKFDTSFNRLVLKIGLIFQ